ncbi:MAG: hypothetical protein ABJH04_07380 [Cyclobacteriaceae bacterium]
MLIRIAPILFFFIVIGFQCNAQFVVFDAEASLDRKLNKAIESSRFLQQMRNAVEVVKYGMETAGTAKQIYESGKSAVNMMKAAFGDFKNMGDMMSIYSMGQVKLLNLHNQWEREYSNHVDYEMLYYQATAKYRFNGQLDPYKIIEQSALNGVSVTTSMRVLLDMSAQYDTHYIGYLLSEAKFYEERALEYDGIANRLAMYMSFVSVGGSTGSLDAWLKSTAEMADRTNSELLYGSYDKVFDLRQSMNDKMGGLVKAEMEKFAEKNNISASTFQELSSEIANLRNQASLDRARAADCRERARKISGYSSSFNNLQVLKHIMINEDPGRSVFAY